MESGRMERRTAAGGLAQIEILGQPSEPESAWVENISEHGLRGISQRALPQGERLVISSQFPPYAMTTARVVYCQRLLEGLYAIGCQATKGGVPQLLEKQRR